MLVPRCIFNNSNLAELFRHALLRRVSKNYSGIEKLESCLLRGPAEFLGCGFKILLLTKEADIIIIITLISTGDFLDEVSILPFAIAKLITEYYPVLFFQFP